MGDAGGEPAHGLHLLRLAQLLGQAFMSLRAAQSLLLEADGRGDDAHDLAEDRAGGRFAAQHDAQDPRRVGTDLDRQAGVGPRPGVARRGAARDDAAGQAAQQDDLAEAAREDFAA
jgi:hypothetical protein